MDGETWQNRAKNAGLPQKVFARLAGMTATNASMALRGKWQSGVPISTKTIIRAWEMLTAEQRERLIAATEADDDGA